MSFEPLGTYTNKREMWKDIATRGRCCRLYFTHEASKKGSSLKQFTSARGFWAPLAATAVHPSSCEDVCSHHAHLPLAQQISQTSPILITLGLLRTTPSPKNTDQLLRQGPWAIPTPLHTQESCRVFLGHSPW